MFFAQKTQQHIYRITLKTLCLGVLLLAGAQSVSAATLSLKPSVTSVGAGSTVSVKVLLNTAGAAVNSADGVIKFPADLFEVVGVSKVSSIFSIWIEEPTYSNAAGTITFSGGLPNPGFVGGAGEVLSVTLKAKKIGSAALALTEASARANDGLGTDLLTAKIPATIQIGPAVPTPPKTTVTTKNAAPGLPVITSLNHPKEDQWYKNTQASFSWNVPASVTVVQASVNTKAVAVPTVAYDGSVSSKTLNNLEDGVYYFNLRQQNEVGWSPTAHFKIQVDATAPLAFVPTVSEDSKRRTVKLFAAAIDETSGVDYYSVSVDDKDDTRVDVAAVKKDGYVLAPQSEGNHTLTVTAYDKAGNARASTLTFVGNGAVAPEITVSPEKVQGGGSVIVSGETLYPQTKVVVSVQSGVGAVRTFDQITDTDGGFKFALNDLTQRGSTVVWAQIVLGDKTLSDSSKKAYFTVADSKISQTLTQYFYPILLITLIMLLIGALFFALYLGWHKFFSVRKKLRTDLQETAVGIHKIMLSMKEELDTQLHKLEKVKADRDLNAKEQKIFRELNKNIDDIDEFIQKKIKKIL